MENTFIITKKVDKLIFLDEKNKKWTIPQGIFKNKIIPSRIYNYSDIINFELLEDGNSISKGGIGRALVGGALFGGVGAIVGGVTGHKSKSTCTRLQIKITVNNRNNPAEYITFIAGEIKKSSIIYKGCFDSAQKIMSLLQIICDENKNTLEKSSNEIESNIDEIKKYKQLLDNGVISTEDFELKKKELLNL